MKSPSSHWSADLDQEFIDKVACQAGWPPGSAAGDPATGPEQSSAQVSAAGNPRVHRSEDRHSLVQDFQRRHVLCAVQSRTTGPRYDLGLPRNGLPYQRVARPVREGDDALRLSASAGWRAGPDCRSRLPMAAQPCAPLPASVSAHWRRSSKSITRSSVT